MTFEEEERLARERYPDEVAKRWTKRELLDALRETWIAGRRAYADKQILKTTIGKLSVRIEKLEAKAHEHRPRPGGNSPKYR